VSGTARSRAGLGVALAWALGLSLGGPVGLVACGGDVGEADTTDTGSIMRDTTPDDGAADGAVGNPGDDGDDAGGAGDADGGEVAGTAGSTGGTGSETDAASDTGTGGGPGGDGTGDTAGDDVTGDAGTTAGDDWGAITPKDTDLEINACVKTCETDTDCCDPDVGTCPNPVNYIRCQAGVCREVGCNGDAECAVLAREGETFRCVADVTGERNCEKVCSNDDQCFVSTCPPAEGPDCPSERGRRYPLRRSCVAGLCVNDGCEAESDCDFQRNTSYGEWRCIEAVVEARASYCARVCRAREDCCDPRFGCDGNVLDYQCVNNICAVLKCEPGPAGDRACTAQKNELNEPGPWTCLDPDTLPPLDTTPTTATLQSGP